MRVFVAGGTGVIGQRIVALLRADGHDVVAMTRSPDGANTLALLGADAVLCDVYDRDRVIAVVGESGADLIIDELTDLPDDVADIAAHTRGNSRIRREGTANLLAAAAAAGIERFVVQSVAWELPGDGGAAVKDMEAAVLAAGGTVLRYGQFYGPGTYHATRPDDPAVHIDEAARRTLELMGERGIHVITD